MKIKLMIMIRKMLMVTALIMVVGLLKAQEFKIGYTNIDFIVYNMPEVEGIGSELQTYSKQLGTQVKSKEDALRAKMEQLQTMAQEPNADRAALQKLNDEVTKMRADYQSFAQNAEQAYGAKEAEKMNPVYQKVQNAIEAVRVEIGLQMVLNSQISGGGGIVLAADESLNITEQIFTKLNVPMPEAPPQSPASEGAANNNNGGGGK